jgi:hypothetical protein
MKRKKITFIIIVCILLAMGIVTGILFNRKITIDQFTSVNRFPEIHPDYQAIVIPPNIAPLNFIVKEPGTRYFTKIYSVNGKAIEVESRTAVISIPEKLWRQLLDSNLGEKLKMDLFVRDENNNWNRFKTMTNHIAEEEIDPYLLYRKIHPFHNTWCDMGLYQRNLQNYNESPVLKNDRYRYGCAHCHAFNNNNPEQISIVIRSGEYQSGQLMVEGDDVYKIKGKLSFTAWHPSGRLLACSVNKPPLILHANRNEMRDIVDVDSWIGYFFLNSKDIQTIPQLSREDFLENYPTWSPDGKYLYFTCEKKPWTDQNVFPPDHFNYVKYDLMRISYDIEKDQWGKSETVLSSRQTGLSINQPRVSPDGNWITFPMCEYSCWPAYHPNSDLYILDLKKTERTGRPEYRKMEINSDECESWHTWSSNSRWIVFSSKRNNPLFNRLHITYIDENGKVSKPFVIPQKDPVFYDSYLHTYTIPELATGPVKTVGEKLARIVRGSPKKYMNMAITGATTKAERH